MNILFPLPLILFCLLPYCFFLWSSLFLSHHSSLPLSSPPLGTGSTVVDWLVAQGKARNRPEGLMMATALLHEGFLQPAGELSKAGAEDAAESVLLDQPEAFYYFVSEMFTSLFFLYLFEVGFISTCNRASLSSVFYRLPHSNVVTGFLVLLHGCACWCKSEAVGAL